MLTSRKDSGQLWELNCDLFALRTEPKFILFLPFSFTVGLHMLKSLNMLLGSVEDAVEVTADAANDVAI